MKAHRRGIFSASPSTPALPTGIIQEVDESQGNTPNSCGPERIPPPWSWHYRTLVHLRDRLMRSHGIVDTHKHRHELDRLLASLSTVDDKLFEVDCALQRIHDGVYGFCEETGHPIPSERLRAAPWIRYCREVAEQREQPAPRPPPQ
jgi:RNA polymerase-binding transcription factor DksA